MKLLRVAQFANMFAGSLKYAMNQIVPVMQLVVSLWLMAIVELAISTLFGKKNAG